MTHFELISIVLTVIAIILIPTLGLMVRGAVKWTRTEDQLARLVVDVRGLVSNEDKTHAAMLQQMTYDRDATDRRMRFIEEWFMRIGQPEGPAEYPPGLRKRRKLQRHPCQIDQDPPSRTQLAGGLFFWFSLTATW